MLKINQHTKETIKTVVIAILVTGIIAFVGGMKYQQYTNAQVHAEAKAMAVTSLKR